MEHVGLHSALNQLCDGITILFSIFVALWKDTKMISQYKVVDQLLRITTIRCFGTWCSLQVRKHFETFGPIYKFRVVAPRKRERNPLPHKFSPLTKERRCLLVTLYNRLQIPWYLFLMIVTHVQVIVCNPIPWQWIFMVPYIVCCSCQNSNPLSLFFLIYFGDS